MNRRALALLSAFLLVFAVACGDDDSAADDTGGGTTTTEPAGDDGTDDQEAPMVVVDGAWARTSPTMASNGAAYMELTASADDRLVGARAVGELAASVEVHETVMDPDTGEMAMSETEGIDLPAGETIALEPGGYHVMLVDLVEPLEPGSTFELVLEFESSGEVTVDVEVRDTADMDEGDMDDGDMGDEG